MFKLGVALPSQSRRASSRRCPANNCEESQWNCCVCNTQHCSPAELLCIAFTFSQLGSQSTHCAEPAKQAAHRQNGK